MTSIVLNTTSPPPPSHRPQESPIGSGKPHLHGHNGHDGRDGHDGHDGHDGQIPPLCRFLSKPPLLAILALCQRPEIGNELNVKCYFYYGKVFCASDTEVLIHHTGSLVYLSPIEKRSPIIPENNKCKFQLKTIIALISSDKTN